MELENQPSPIKIPMDGYGSENHSTYVYLQCFYVEGVAVSACYLSNRIRMFPHLVEEENKQA